MSALIILVIGAMSSVGFMVQAGRYQKSLLLIALFTGWVLSPFIALVITTIISKSWSIFYRRILYGMIIIITLGSLVMYSGTLNFTGQKPAFKFLIVPFISWLLIAIFLAPILIKRRGRSRNTLNQE
ncbi:MAG: hypothetical protein ABIO01_05870 [Ferruginibacter sp.]